MKKLILETLSLFQEDLIIEKLLKEYLYLKEKKDGGLIIKLIKNNNVLIFDPSIEEELDLLYDHLYPIVVWNIEHELGKEYLNKLNTKRIYDLLEIVINRVINIFKSKNDDKKINNTIEKYILNKLRFKQIKPEFYRLVYDDMSTELHNINLRKVYGTPQDMYEIPRLFTTYSDLIRIIHRDLSTNLGLTYRETKNAIISAIDKVIKKFVKSYIKDSDKNFSDIIRSYRKID
jgi:hypothetical protein